MSYTNATTFDIKQHDGSTKGLKLAGTLVTSTPAELNILDGVTATAAELNYNDIATLGTGAASKAVVLSASSNYTSPGAGTWAFASGSTVNVAGTFQIGGVTVGSSAAEIDLQCDASLQTETIAEGGVVSVTKRITKVVSTGAGAITIAAPDSTMLGMVKIIEMTGGEHDVTLALTNVQGQSSGTTATFSDINDTLVLVAGTLKWNVVGEAGIALS